MSETGSCLAVVEKKPQRLAGCVGIFSQLFDWNRKLAKKKLFSKKLLPPVGLKKASKNFGGDEKQPKLHLIADENSGGFPNAKMNDRDTNSDLVIRRETRAPSLIARLMGLESMPQVQRKKPKKVVESSFRNDNSELIGENGGFKNEPRPQKLQKTSSSEKRAVTKFGSDSLPFKSVLSRSKKYHHPKLPVPVKSAGNVSRRNSSKLIGAAAARILEPGLQTSRSKCALTYSNNSHQPSKLNAAIDDSDHFPCVIMKEQPSYRKCGHSLDNNPNSEPCFNKEPINFAPPSNSVGFCSPVTEKSMPEQSFYEEIEEPPEGLPSSSRSKNQNQTYQANTVHSRSKFGSVKSNDNVSTTVLNERRSFVLPNRSMNGNTRENYEIEMEKKIYDRLSDIVPPGRKRRPTNIPKHAESSMFMSSTGRRQTHCNPLANSSRDFGYNVHSVSQQRQRSDFTHLQHRTLGSYHEGNNAASFTFNSSAKQKTRVHAVEKRGVQNESGSSRRVQKSDFKENGSKKYDKHINGDALSALLEQKLKELNSLGDDTRSNVPKKSTAVILQELICALTSEMSFMQNKLEATCECNSSQANELESKLSVDQLVDYEHLSPGSVLEAFSNESCLSSNHDDNLGYKMPSESVDCCSCPHPRSFKRYPELAHSSNSVAAETSSKKSVIEIIDIVSETLCSINLTNGLNGCKLDHTQEILVNSELIFRSATHSSPFLQRGYSIKHLFVEIETLATVLWMKFGSSLGVEDCNEVRGFAFDSIIEYLELRCEAYLTFGSKELTKMPLCMNANMLVFEIIEEVRKWKELSRYVLDELIDMEMSRSSKDWTRFEYETFDTSIDISQQVLQCLLDEILMDLCDC